MFNHKFRPIYLLLALALPAFIFLLRPGIYWNMHDDMQMVRQLELEKCINDGQIPCRWVPDLGNGYGYPLFNFYPPLPYIIGLPFRGIGLSFVTTIKLTAALQFVLSAIGMYLLASNLYGRLGGLISALFYTYAPYHALNIYVRGAMNESWASVFFPFILYFAKKFIEGGKTVHLLFLSLSLSFLLLSHNPMVLIFSPIALIWSIYWIFQQKTKNVLSTILKLSGSALLGLGISAFFTLPAIFETNLVQIDSMFSGYYHYSNHFVSLYQLFISNFWGSGGSSWGPNDGMSFSVGYLHWIIPLLTLIYLTINAIKKRQLSVLEWSVGLTILLGIGSTFMAHERSTFIWKIITPIQKIQFPWRFLNVSTFLLSLSCGFISQIFKKINFKNNFILTFSIVGILILLNVSHFTPITSGPITDAQKFSGVAWANQVTGSIYDYLPKTVPVAPVDPAKDYISSINPSNSTYSLTGQKKGTNWTFFNIELSTPSTIFLPIFYFPRTDITVDGIYSNSTYDPKTGLVKIMLQKGSHQIYVKQNNTPIRSISNVISLIAIICIIMLTFVLYERRRNNSTKR